MKMKKLGIISTTAALAAMLTVTCGFATSAATNKEPSVETSFVEAAIPANTNNEAKEGIPFLHYIFDDDSIQEVSEETFQSVLNKDSEQRTEQRMLYYFFHDDNIYELSKKQFDEVIENNNMDEIVQRDALSPIVQSENLQDSNYNNVENAILNDTRATGRWTIDNAVGAGVRMNYYMPDGGSFVVNSGETCSYQIAPDRPCWITAGVFGSREFSTGSIYIDKKSYGGINLGTDKPGSFNYYVVNDNSFDINVEGSVSIEKLK